MRIEKTSYNKFDCGKKGNLRTRKYEDDFFMELKINSGTIHLKKLDSEQSLRFLIDNNLFINQFCECYQIVENDDED